jgi:hypothetical protein
MELIEIISDILIFGGVLLVFVVAISFLLFKSKKEDNRTGIYKTSKNAQTPAGLQRRINKEQQTFRNNQTLSYPQIFQITNYTQQELKIVRKRTMDKRGMQERMIYDDAHLKATNGTGVRYTIVNEEINKSNIKTANFYL